MFENCVNAHKNTCVVLFARHAASGLLCGVLLGAIPNGKAERDLVHKVGKVVHKIERAVINSRLEVSKEVAKWVDGPTNGHNELHNVESGHTHTHTHAHTHTHTHTPKHT